MEVEDGSSAARSDGSADGVEAGLESDPAAVADAGDVPLQVGTSVGEYVVERVVGSGGFGTVYEARQPLIEKRVAIKVLAAKYSADPRSVARFVEEARIANTIGHPNILGVFSFGRLDDGRHYHVTDFVVGETLEALLRRRGALPLDQALPILEGIAAALEAAHREGVVHRDLKPANVLLVAHDDRLVPKVIDFGIAKLLGDEAEAHKTRSGALLGTPLYMSPEQCRGRVVDERSDVYSFGVVAYEMLVGRPPFDAEEAVDVLLQKTSQDPVPASRVGSSLPAAVDPVLMGMLAKEPSRRPARPGIAVRALKEIAAEATRPGQQARKGTSLLLPAALLGALALSVGALALARRPVTEASGTGASPVASASGSGSPSSEAHPRAGARGRTVDGTSSRSTAGEARAMNDPPDAAPLDAAGGEDGPGDAPKRRSVASEVHRNAAVPGAGAKKTASKSSTAVPTPAPGPDDTESPQW